MANKTGITINELAKELGIGKQRAIQIKNAAIKKKIVPNSSFNLKNSKALLYPPQMVSALKSAYDSGKFGKPRAKTSTKGQLKESKVQLNPFADAMKDLEKHKELKHVLKAFVNSVKHLLD